MQHPFDSFAFKVALWIIFCGLAQDQIHDTAYMMTLAAPPMEEHIVSWKDHPLTLQLHTADTKPANAMFVFLFDVCADPGESTNLASPQPEDVRRLHQVLLEETQRAPLQFAADLVDPSTPENAKCAVFLEDDADLASRTAGVSRLVPQMMQRVIKMLVPLVLGVLAVAVYLLRSCWRWCCRGGGRGAEKRKRPCIRDAAMLQPLMQQ